MAKNHDIVAIGAGHNGLVAAAYLAARGQGCAGARAQCLVTGAASSPRSSPGPGYLHDRFSTGHIFIQANPLMKKR